jgi:hypothetical protein
MTWSVLDPMATTNTCTGSGEWTAFGIMLPSSANNNPSVKIGFNWINNDDGSGGDPSFSVDDITLVPNALGVAEHNASMVNIFADNSEIVVNANGNAFTALSMTDMLGRSVSFTRSGNRLQPADVQPGIYVVNLDVNGVRVSKKVMLR